MKAEIIIPTAPQETSQRPPPLLANHDCSLISEINQSTLSVPGTMHDAVFADDKTEALSS